MARKTVITGGSSGLGLALAHALAKQGDELTLVARNAEKLAAVAVQIRAESPTAKVHCYSLDVANDTAMTEGMMSISKQMGGIDLLINSAGIMREGHFESLTDANFREVFDINLFGVINSCRAALPFLKDSHGAIVNIASMGAHMGVFGYSAYCASKHALKGFTEALYHELTPHNVRVQLICPPEFDSPMADALDKKRTPENQAQTLMIPKEPVDVIVRDTLKAIRSGNYHTITGLNAKIVGFGIQHFSGVARRIATRVIRKARAEK
jgi:3-dehydrosphinganine reductase